MAKENSVEYTPEELAEIERIVSYVTTQNNPEKPLEKSPIDTDSPDLSNEGFDDLNIGEPDVFDLPDGNLDNITDHDEIENIAIEESADSIDEISSDEFSDIPTDDLLSEMGVEKDVADANNQIDELGDIPVEDIDNIDPNKIKNITDIITEVEPEQGEELNVPLSSSKSNEELTDSSLDDLMGGDFSSGEGESDINFDENEFNVDDIVSEEVSEEKKDVGDIDSPLGQLNELTADEPESIDAQDFADDTFVGGSDDFQDVSPKESSSSLDEEFSEDIGGIEDLSGEIKSEDSGVEINSDLDDVPNLDDLSVEDVGDFANIEENELPDMDIEDIGFSDDSSNLMDVEDIPGEDNPLEDMDNLQDLDEIDSSAEEQSLDSQLDDIDIDIDDEITEPMETLAQDSELDSGLEPPTDDGISDIEDDFVVEPLDDDVASLDGNDEIATTQDSTEGIDLSDEDLKKLRSSILLFNPGVKQAIKDAVINDELSPSDTRILVDMIIAGKPENNVQRFLEKKLKIRIQLLDGSASGRKIITSRPEYTLEGRERQKRLLKRTKIFGAVAAATIVITVLSYNFIYIPLMAKHLINKGVVFIIKRGDLVQKNRDYDKAENIFREVNEDYIQNFLYGYREYGRAYLLQKEYEKSLGKLNFGYKNINKIDINLLNQLGFFYSKIPKSYYNRLQKNVATWYFPKNKPPKADISQLELAINFFNRVLLENRKNVTAMLGIGNAYFEQGQYLNAKKYYQSIIAVDSKSIAGYSGLLNLYIERDNFPLITSIHSRLREKDLMEEMPSPLLAKFASYYLSKIRTPKMNVRVDYGLTSPRLKDINDNPFPAVKSVLRALNSRDDKYPPLYVEYAKFYKLKNNLRLMKLYLDKALKISPKYFAALQMRGEYFYDVNEPDKAYINLTKALKFYNFQPEFTRDFFYKEEGNVGKAYAIIGNVFYYYFDKIKLDYGNLKNDIQIIDKDRMINFSISEKKYKKALEFKYDNSEIRYNLGRIYYLKGLYKKALGSWLHLYDDFVNYPEIMFSIGNAFYHLENYDAAKGEYLKFIAVASNEAENIRIFDASQDKQKRLFETLSAVYNNLGSVYYRLDSDDSRSSISFWKAVELSKRMNKENEFARVNLARTFNRANKSEPIIDENLPFSLKYFEPKKIK